MLTAKRALQVILAVGIVGFFFSGYLTYRDLFTTAEQSCTPVGEPGTILGYPPCVYGMSMYLVIDVLAALGLANASSEKRRLPPSTAATHA